MLIAYVAIAHGGLGLMDPHTRVIPDFVLTMTSATRAATTGFYMGRDHPVVKLPLSIAHHFSPSHNLSDILLRYHRFLPSIAAIAAPKAPAGNAINHFSNFCSPKSARDRLRHAASSNWLQLLHHTAPPALQADLSEILISPRPTHSLPWRVASPPITVQVIYVLSPSPSSKNCIWRSSPAPTFLHASVAKPSTHMASMSSTAPRYRSGCATTVSVMALYPFYSVFFPPP